MFKQRKHHTYVPQQRHDTMPERVKRDIARQQDYRRLCAELCRDWKAAK